MKVRYGLKNESSKKKIAWFRTLSPTERYERMLEIASFSEINRKIKRQNDRGPFKTIQVLKQT